MRDTRTRNAEIKIMRCLAEARGIMDKYFPDYAAVNICITPESLSMFTSDKNTVNYALPNMHLCDRREDGDNFCSYNEADGSTGYEDAARIALYVNNRPD